MIVLTKLCVSTTCLPHKTLYVISVNYEKYATLSMYAQSLHFHKSTWRIACSQGIHITCFSTSCSDPLKKAFLNLTKLAGGGTICQMEMPHRRLTNINCHHSEWLQLYGLTLKHGHLWQKTSFFSSKGHVKTRLVVSLTNSLHQN